MQLANSAGKASRNVSIKKIIYLGGIVPRNQKASPHLMSRMKTGQALASYGIPVPLFAIHMSALWIQLITGVPNSVGVSLAEGLRTNTAPSQNRFKEVTGGDPTPLESVLRQLAKKMHKKTM